MVLSLQHRWLVSMDPFVMTLNFRLPNYFIPASDPMSLGMETMLQSWDNLEVYTFPLFAMIRLIWNKL